jgi:hypothetical protein
MQETEASEELAEMLLMEETPESEEMVEKEENLWKLVMQVPEE